MDKILAKTIRNMSLHTITNSVFLFCHFLTYNSQKQIKHMINVNARYAVGMGFIADGRNDIIIDGINVVTNSNNRLI
jgi:hypothetical protein